MSKKKKKGNRGKKIGNAFENVVAKLIRKAVAKKFKDDICMRVPNSGGHPMIGGGDIVLRQKLRKIFDFCIECKHRKTFKIYQMFDDNKAIAEYISQTLANTFEEGGHPLLVARGYRTPILCATTLKSLNETGFETLVGAEVPGMVFRFRGKIWKMFLFKMLLKELKLKVKHMD